MAPRRFLRVCAVVLMGFCAQPVTALRAATHDEYQVKAVFLFNFTQFVAWPNAAFPSGSAPFVIGVLGHDPFGPVLDDVVRGESVAGRPIVVRRIHDPIEIDGAHILFIDRSADPGLVDAVSRRLGTRPTLTVTDDGATDVRDPVVQFRNVDNRIRLRINVASAQAAGLVISSKLLRPAEIVGRERVR
jgi:hypothetical protein